MMVPCTYCGELGYERDHVPPLKWRKLFRSTGVLVAGIVQWIIVPACTRCNAMLSCRALFNIAERRAYIRARLRGKQPRPIHDHLFHVLQRLGRTKRVAA